jgi:hypothetical protein
MLLGVLVLAGVAGRDGGDGGGAPVAAGGGAASEPGFDHAVDAGGSATETTLPADPPGDAGTATATDENAAGAVPGSAPEAASSPAATGGTGGNVASLPAADPLRPATILDITEPLPDVPNPAVVLIDGVYHLYATQTRLEEGGWALLNVPLRISTDLRRWQLVGDVLPQLGAWAEAGHTWAPDVRQVGPRRWVLYYTAHLAGREPGAQCIGAAVAATPRGPFVPVGTEPLVCQLDRWGSIDPRTFVAADGELWLHWKSDDNADVEGTTLASIYAQRLDRGGTRLLGEAVRILEVDQPWEGRIVEAPQMVRDDRGRHWLFYSGNWFNQPAYAIGVAACAGPAGPCHKPFDRPFIASNAQGQGPGEASLFHDAAGRLRIIYAPTAQHGPVTTYRPAALATVAFDDTGPYLARNQDP